MGLKTYLCGVGKLILLNRVATMCERVLNYKAMYKMRRTKKYAAGLVFGLLLLSFWFAPLRAQDTPAEKPAGSAVETITKIDRTSTSDIDSLAKVVAQMQAQLDAQNKKIDALESKYATDVDSRDKELEKQRQIVSDQAEKIDTQREAMQSLQQQVDQMAASDQTELSTKDKELRSRLLTVEQSIQTSQKAESTEYDIDSFPGSIPIPGSSAAIRIGGFVKMNAIESFDPIRSTDRFVVGTIPVPQEDAPSGVVLSVSQTRLNFDLRDTTKQGAFRAFIEGDFADASSGTGFSDGNNFRLRHAYGQYKYLLLGKTWSTFMDFDAIPEELDFEGINGQINLRQAQIRYFPSFGANENWNLLISAEDPDPRIGGGDGISQIPDLVFSIRREWFKRWHVKTAVLLRQLDAECTSCISDSSDKATGWGLTASGKAQVRWWDKRDNIILQVNYGEGYGHYINDLRKIGQPDAIFNPTTGELEVLPVFAYYIAFQKWWSNSMRSNFNYGYVDIKNLSFQPTDAYDKTRRLSGSFIWSPTARVDLGTELLYGERQNKNKDKANATQLQLSGTYRY